MERRFARGIEFEREVVADLRRLYTEAIVVQGASAGEVETATADAMARAVPLILNSRLASDMIGRRVGKPDLLSAATGGGYRPVDIKHHMTLEPATSTRGLPGLCAELDLPSLEHAVIDPDSSARKRKDDLLQLAHYQRMLEAAGLAAPDGRHGGIIGVERRVVWYDLDAPIWRTSSASGGHKVRTTMEVYDFEFDFRLDIMAAAQMHVADPATDLLVVPVRIGECEACPWWDHCRPLLQAGTGDVSLVPRIGWREWKTHQEHGVTDRAELAALDITTARLVSAGIDVAELIAQARETPQDTSIAELPTVRQRPVQLAQLEVAGVSTAADVSKLSEITASYLGSGLSSLADQIDLARAALGPAPVYRRRGVDAITVPRADVEVDVDMENSEDGVYLWGTLLSDRLADPPSAVYHPFVTWEPLTPDEQVQSFVRFWHWLMERRDSAQAAGGTFRAYCYHAAAENTYLRSLGRAAGVIDQVEGFISSDDWVDMLRVVDSQLITGQGVGLKVVAPLAGFSWEVDEPGGAESMLRYEVAVGSGSGTGSEEARHWLLTYNRGDVEATLALRDWLERDADSIPPVEGLDPGGHLPRPVGP